MKSHLEELREIIKEFTSEPVNILHPMGSDTYFELMKPGRPGLLIDFSHSSHNKIRREVLMWLR